MAHRGLSGYRLHNSHAQTRRTRSFSSSFLCASAPARESRKRGEGMKRLVATLVCTAGLLFVTGQSQGATDTLTGGSLLMVQQTTEGGSASEQPEAGRKPVTYAQVAPIFNSRCVKCHTAKGVMGPPPEGLRLDSYEAIFTSPDRQVVIPGSPDTSPLLRTLRGQSVPRMPFGGPPYLTNEQIQLIADWVKQGALDADGKKPVNR